MFTVTYNFSSSARARRRLRAARLALCLGTLACILLSQFAAFAQACAGVRKDTLRLHILANSDSPQDQALKLAVRDAILEEYGNLFAQQMCIRDSFVAAPAAQRGKPPAPRGSARVRAKGICPVHAGRPARPAQAGRRPPAATRARANKGPARQGQRRGRGRPATGVRAPAAPWKNRRGTLRPGARPARRHSCPPAGRRKPAPPA